MCPQLYSNIDIGITNIWNTSLWNYTCIYAWNCFTWLSLVGMYLSYILKEVGRLSLDQKKHAGFITWEVANMQRGLRPERVNRGSSCSIVSCETQGVTCYFHLARGQRINWIIANLCHQSWKFRLLFLLLLIFILHYEEQGSLEEKAEVLSWHKERGKYLCCCLHVQRIWACLRLIHSNWNFFSTSLYRLPSHNNLLDSRSRRRTPEFGVRWNTYSCDEECTC